MKSEPMKTNNRPNIKPGMSFKLRYNYAPWLRKGSRGVVDAMRKDSNCASGFRVRVRFWNEDSELSRSRYFDAGWITTTTAKG